MDEIGEGHLEQVEDTLTAMEKVRNEVSENPPDVVVLMSPHSPILGAGITVFGGTSAEGDFGPFGHPHIRARMNLDLALADKVTRELQHSIAMPVALSPMTPTLDHGALVPLMKGFGVSSHAEDSPKLVWLSISPTDHNGHYEVGRAIRRAVAGSNAVFLASGDLSHRLTPDAPAGYDPGGAVFDQSICEAFSSGELDSLLALDPMRIEEAGECGLRPLVALAGCFADSGPDSVHSELYSYEGPFGVGYMVAKVYEGPNE